MTFTFTLGQLLGGILAACSGIGIVAGAVVWIVKGVRAVQAPDRRQDERIKNAEERLDKHDRLFDNDNKRLKTAEEESRILMRAMMAMLDHGIDGNHIEPMKASKAEINNFLTQR